MRFELSSLLVAAVATSAAVIERAPLEKRAACTSYTIINTRGTGEAQGESAGFKTMNANIIAAIPGGKRYNTVYAADYSQNSAAGTTDIVNKVTSTLATNPSECFILEGYSQGAAATVNAMPKLTGAAFTAVRGVILVGDPEHKSGLACNIDNNGGTTTLNVNGLQYTQGSIPAAWVAKTRDICIYGDGVCDTTHGYGVNQQHLQYPNDAPTQNLGTTYGEQVLRATS